MENIKTVADLVSDLSKLPQDAMILIQGYEGGFSEIGLTKLTAVELNHYKEDWNGPHEITDKGNAPAVILLRKENF